LPYLTFSHKNDPLGSPLGLQDRCFLYQARAFLVNLNQGTTISDSSSLPSSLGCNQEKDLAVCVELVGSRFIRQMIRLLVSTTVRESLVDITGDKNNNNSNGWNDNLLLDYCHQSDRNLSARAMPPEGLCFAGAGYDDYDLSFYEFMPKKQFLELVDRKNSFPEGE
jgi:hypothetical protein